MTSQIVSGPVPALTSIYSQVIEELKELLHSIPEEQITKVLKQDAPEDFRSVSSIIKHVVYSGYQYANYIRLHVGLKDEWPEIMIGNKNEALSEIDKMFSFTLSTCENIRHYTDDQLLSTIIKTSWSTYDMEALLEHAIVHIMRHARQIRNLVTEYGVK